ncbi:hypothetical protein [Streptosporangium sp. NPDC002524]|uniref:hypothetical protein n=1 Tax=Streptosporangium sp. NPDC002524 TaxID=3154537 RepID=UPI00332E8288
MATRSRSRIRSSLAKQIAAKVARVVDAVNDDLADQTRQDAPDGKTWHAQPGARPSHAAAHTQAVPANVPYRLDRMVYVRKGRGADGKAVNAAGGWKRVPGGWDLADRPRDPDLPEHQAADCRCKSMPAPGAIAATVATTAAKVTGTRVTARTRVTFPRVAESELADRGGGWAAGAVRAAAARARGRSTGR